MMTTAACTVTLSRRYSGFVNVDDQFWVVEPGFENAVDDFKEMAAGYCLPDGYTVARTKYDETAIFDPDGVYCEIIEHRPTGRPQLVSGSRKGMPVLTRKAED